MKVSYNWLKNYVNFTQTPEELSIILTACGLEVEGLEAFEAVQGGLRGVVIGEVKTCEKHPDADKLSITTVDIGVPDLLNIVCGAPNVAAGQKVLVATIGTKLYNGDQSFEIKKSKIRGQVSEGMICAEDELGLGTSHDGIMVLDASAVVGTPASEYFNIETDYIIEIGLTPNRNDATSHIGVARDIAAALNAENNTENPLMYPDLSAFKIDNTSFPVAISVENAEECPRYSGLTFRNVKVGESPDWLKNRLKAVGIRPINNIVDITNFILMEYGQPLHAFDAAEISDGKIFVKHLPKDTIFKTLDGVERKLNGNEIMICNSHGGMCIGGIFGGEKSGVTEKTTSIFLESAYFNPVSIRKSSKYHGLKTDASFRYERGADPNITIDALKRAAILIKELTGAEISSEIVDIYPAIINKKHLEISLAEMKRILGIDIPVEKTLNILKSLEMSPVLNADKSIITIDVPTNKFDVTRDIDVMEEILRIYGFDKIEAKGVSQMMFSYQAKPDREKVYNLIADIISGCGFSEIMNNSFTKAEHTEKVAGFDSNLNVKIANALSNELDTMRQSLLFGGLSSIAYNCHHQNMDLKFFEFGQVYSKNPDVPSDAPVTKKYKETQHLSILVTGNKLGENWHNLQQKTDFGYLKSIVNLILQRLRLNDIILDDVVPGYLSEGLTYKINGKPLIAFGKISKATLKYFDIKQDVYYADFVWDSILKALPKKIVKYTEVPKFPEVRRDLALLLDKQITFKQIEDIAYKTDKKLLKAVNLFDVYEGEKLPEGKKSYAVSFILQDTEKTLSEKAINSVMDKLISQYQTLLNASIR